jgi:hypothetical protein
MILRKIAMVSWNIIELSVFVTEMQHVFSEVETEFLNII